MQDLAARAPRVRAVLQRAAKSEFPTNSSRLRVKRSPDFAGRLM
jgi:hypothetical protein